jgi:hypothetical protein
MSLEYYMFCKEKYEFIIKYLDGIDDLYNDIIIKTCNEEPLIEEQYFKIFLSDRSLTSLNKKIENIKALKQICDEKIFELCEHEFIDDMIDITPDRSERIIYCGCCGYTK